MSRFHCKIRCMLPITPRNWFHIRYALCVYLLGILFFFFFRTAIVCCNLDALQHVPHHKWQLLAEAFWMGYRFDTVIACYLMVLPLFLGGVTYMAGMLSRPLLKALYIYVAIVFSLAFLLCAVDVPFFNHFYKRLNDTIFNWNNAGGFGVKMVLEEPRFYVFFFIFILLNAAYLYLLKRSWKKHRLVPETSYRQWYVALPALLVIWFMTFFGIRGRLSEKSPIIPGTAFFSSDPFINQLGLNPVFTLMRSMLDSANPDNDRLHWLYDGDALKIMKRLLKGETSLQAISPIARWQHTKPAFKNRNIVLVIMESMAGHRMDRFGNKGNLTPFLDSIARTGWSFDSLFSAGIHTYNGIYTTLFAHPALMKRHTMDQVTVPRMAGFSNMLAAQGYQTIFFTTHDELFDNMSGFLSANDFSKIVGQKDYPFSEIKSTLGVPDEYMFRVAIPRLNDLSKNNQPFFAAFMTGSNHEPNIVPLNTGFTLRHKEPDIATVEYADWSVRKFMSYAVAQPWYKNTVFVFVADHGIPLWNDIYDAPFSFQHIPFLIYAPGANDAKAVKKLALQSDVFPTVMGMVSGDYINNTFGIDLFSQDHSCIVFSSDDVLTCMNDSLLYIYHVNGATNLYKYRNGDKADYMARYPEMADSMSRIAFSWLQTSQWMLEHGKAEGTLKR